MTNQERIQELAREDYLKVEINQIRRDMKIKSPEERAREIAYEVCKDLPTGEEKDVIVYYCILAAGAVLKRSFWCKAEEHSDEYLMGYLDGRIEAENKLLKDYGIVIMSGGELRMEKRRKEL